VHKTTLSLLLLLAIGSRAATALTDYEVRKGQTLSYIAFLKLGAWDETVAAQLKADNPGLDLDRVEVGQKIKLRLPSSDPLKPVDPQKQLQVASKKAVVTMVRGSGKVVRAGGGSETLRPNLFLSTGDAVITDAASYAELIIDNQSVLRLNEKTQVKMLAIQAPQVATATEKRPFYTRIALVTGKTWAKVQKWAGGTVNYQIQLPTAIAGVHGTVFESVAKPDSTGEVSVYQGEVGVGGSAAAPAKKSLAPTAVSGPKEVAMGEWIHILKAGQKIEVPKAGLPEAPKEFKVSVGDPWVDMNRERDCLCD